MGARGNLWHDTAEIRMELGLAIDDGGQNLAAPVVAAHDRGGGIVTTAFKTKNNGHDTRVSDCCVAVAGQVTPAGLSHNPGDSLLRNRSTLLLTRPEASSRRFLAELRASLGSDWPAVISPLMRTRFFDAVIPDCAGMVFTSETAVRAVARLSADRRALAWCVGRRTEEAARASGFVACGGPGTAEGLAGRILAANPGGLIFCPTAADQAFDMEGVLKMAGLETISTCLYAQEACQPTAEAKALLAASGLVVLPIFSARSGRLAVTAFADRTAPLFVAAISDQAVVEARALNPERITIARSPDAAALIAAIAALEDSSESG